jgi:hypothetical protein
VHSSSALLKETLLGNHAGHFPAEEIKLVVVNDFLQNGRISKECIQILGRISNTVVSEPVLGKVVCANLFGSLSASYLESTLEPCTEDSQGYLFTAVSLLPKQTLCVRALLNPILKNP